MKATEMCKYAVFPNQRLDAKNALIGTTHVTYISKVILTGETTLNTRIRRKATNPENPIWIIVNVIGSGKLKYFGDRTHLLYSITPEERIM
jgi:hypothetical protein